MELLFLNARAAVVKIANGYFSVDEKIPLFINGKVTHTDRIITKILDLTPETDYNLKYGEDSLSFTTPAENYTVNVRKLGAVGDGVSDDTTFIQAAIAVCPPHSRVLIPPGRYAVSSLFLKSDIDVEISTGAELIFTHERKDLPYLPGLLETYDEKNVTMLGSWEGNPLPMFCSMINGFGVENVCIYGGGLLDGNALPSDGADWWIDEKRMVTAFRPRIMFFENCKNITVIGLTLKNSPCWTIHPFFSKNISIYSLDVNNPKISPNTDGINPESCENVKICGVKFTLGDDCVAVKSGKIWAAKKFNRPCKDIEISHCLMQNGHGAVTVGSEMAAGVYGLNVHHCEFSDTDRGLRVKTRRGRGELAVIDDINLHDIKMSNVKVPFAVNAFYFCDPDGKSDYVQTRKALPVDERTPKIKRITLTDIGCTGVTAAAGFFYGLPESPIERISLKNVSFSFAETLEAFTPEMLCGVPEVSHGGFYCYGVHEFLTEEISGAKIEDGVFDYV